ncbi:uncharacterized protein LOC113521881 [Galleria mellonella]|uniref:Uncharacterized protein LOC113521881 n=1 Tax=Galleria mellonella TaxID=7137 RepID=A0ABM3MWL4_GALME|nr:uncharacterized protein LOC113521881 [Galleria mellonella]
MNLITFAAIISISSASRLSNVYLPQKQGTSSSATQLSNVYLTTELLRAQLSNVYLPQKQSTSSSAAQLSNVYLPQKQGTSSSAAQLSNVYLPQKQGTSSSAAQLSNVYLPQKQGTLSSATQLSNVYLPQKQGTSSSAAQLSNVYLPQKQGTSSSAAQLSNVYLPQKQGTSSSAAQLSNVYLPQKQGTSSSAALLSNVYLPQKQGNSQNSLTAAYIRGGSDNAGNRRPQQEQDRNAQILKQDQKITEDGFYYSYETSNGIRAEEGGDASQTQGGYSYRGDDGNTYTITFVAGEGGFRPQGDHLPVPPPTPRAILEALLQNERDEAAGIFDDGQYRPANGDGQSGTSFGSSSRQGTFNANTGYRY